MGNFIVAGIVQFETIVKVSAIPVAFTPISNFPYSINVGVAGDALSECKALRALGDEVSFLSMVGKKDQKTIVNMHSQELEIKTDYILPVLESTPSAVIFYDDEGKQQIYEDIKDLRDKVYDESIFSSLLPSADMVVLANSNFCRPLLKLAKDAGKSVGVNLRGLRKSSIEYNTDFLSNADVVYFGDDFIEEEPFTLIKRIAETYGNEIIIYGMGDKGAILYVKKDGFIGHYKSVKTKEIINTIGAGEAMFSCFLHFYHKGYDPYRCIKNALLFASYKIGYIGSSVGFLSEEELEKWHSLIWK